MTGLRLAAAIAVVVGILAGRAQADPTAIGIGGFSAADTVVDYGPPVTTPVPVDGATIGGVLHNYSGGAFANIVDPSGPDINGLEPSNLDGDADGVLLLTFAGTITRMGFDFARNTSQAIIDAVTIELFDGAISLGSLSYDAVPIDFVGGFAGIEDLDGFTSARITWSDTPSAGRFLIDNLIYGGGTASVPEPGSLLLLGVGAAIALMRRRRSS